VIISRYGRPVASLVAYERSAHSADARIGCARGEFRIPDDIDTPYGDMAAFFTGTGGTAFV